MSNDIAEIERVWEAHTAAEFVSADVEATMATMTDDPVVLHVPTSIGARGLRRCAVSTPTISSATRPGT
jgi:ketosteroid isomerase-like protein